VSTIRQHVAPAWSERLDDPRRNPLARLLDRDCDVRELGGQWEPLSKPGLGGRQRWRWVLDNGRVTTLYVKRYIRTAWRDQWDRLTRQTMRHSRAWWEYQQSEQLSQAHIPAPRAVACVERMRGLFERRSAVVLERVPGDALDRIWKAACHADSPITRGIARHDFAVRLGRFASAFHGSGLCHRDFYLCHIFGEIDPRGVHPPRFCVIDLARTHRPRWRRMRWIIKDLSQLDASARQVGASRADRLRCLRAYLSLERHSARVRWYARRIVRKSDRILARIARKGP